MNIFQKYNVLYTTMKQDDAVMENAWSSISTEMDIPVNALKTRWKCILDTYSRIKNKETPSTWYMLEHMKFMER